MATFYPSIHDIEQMRDKSTYGELKLIYFLRDYLKDQPDFEVFFQARFDIIHPDIVIMRRGYGVVIIEVKDYNALKSQNYLVMKSIMNLKESCNRWNRL